MNNVLGVPTTFVVEMTMAISKFSNFMVFRDKSKKSAEQSAALVCLKYLGVDDMKVRS